MISQYNLISKLSLRQQFCFCFLPFEVELENRLNDATITKFNEHGENLVYSKRTMFMEHMDLAVEDFHALIQISKYCLVLDGHSAYTHRFLEVLIRGCIPVVVSDSFHPPLARAIDWANAPVIFLRTRHISKIRHILEAIPDSVYEQMQQDTYHLSGILDYLSPAFQEALVYELAIMRDRKQKLASRCAQRMGDPIFIRPSVRTPTPC